MKNILRRVSSRLILVLVCFSWLISANASNFLAAGQAFHAEVTVEKDKGLWIKFLITPGYHLYRDKIKITSIKDSQVQLGQPVWPDPELLVSQGLGRFLVYSKDTTIYVPITRPGNGDLHLKVNYQGCKDLDLCYPEQSQEFKFNLAAQNSLQPGIAQVVSQPAQAVPASTAVDNWRSWLTTDISVASVADFFAHNQLLVIGLFFGLGLLIAFTPCVFPLFPILFTLVAGKDISPRRSFSLAFSYILGGACMYMVAGLVAAHLGYSLNGVVQSDWLNGLIAVIFVVLALAMFDLFQLQLPLAIQAKLNQTINRYGRGSLVNSFYWCDFQFNLITMCDGSFSWCVNIYKYNWQFMVRGCGIVCAGVCQWLTFTGNYGRW